MLSESIQLDRIVDQVAKYAGRFLQADGAIVVLADDEHGRILRVAGASGTLEPLIGQVTEDPDTALVRFAIQRERIEVSQGTAEPSVNLIGGLNVRSAAVAPLRSQGVTMGALAVADRQGGPFTTEDLWLLSTVATNASVVLANSRLYEIVRRSKEEWETAFNALAEGIAVVGPGDAVLRANRALAALAETTEAELVGRSFSEALAGTSEAVAQLSEAAQRGERTAPVVARLEGSGRVLRLTAAPLAERAGPRSGGDAGRGRDGAAHHGGAAHPERQDGLHRPAGVGRGARAQQPAHLDRRADRAAARARPAARLPPRAPARHPRPGRAGRPHRPQPAHLRAEGRAGEGPGRSERRGRANLAVDRLRAAAPRHRAGAGARPDARRRAGRPLRAAAGAAQPDHQRRAGGERPAARPAEEDRRGHQPRGADRRAAGERHRPGGRSAVHILALHALLHDQGPRRRHRPRAFAQLWAREVTRRRTQSRAAARGRRRVPRGAAAARCARRGLGGRGRAGAAGGPARTGSGCRPGRAPAGERAALARGSGSGIGADGGAGTPAGGRPRLRSDHRRRAHDRRRLGAVRAGAGGGLSGRGRPPRAHLCRAARAA